MMVKPNKDFYRRHLPHIQPKGGLFFVTYSLYGSIPKSKLEKIQFEYEELKNKATDNNNKNKARKIYLDNIDQLFITNNSGPHYMKNNQIAEIVANSLHFWDSKTLELYCYCIMSNHSPRAHPQTQATVI